MTATPTRIELTTAPAKGPGCVSTICGTWAAPVLAEADEGEPDFGAETAGCRAAVPSRLLGSCGAITLRRNGSGAASSSPGKPQPQTWRDPEDICRASRDPTGPLRGCW